MFVVRILLATVVALYGVVFGLLAWMGWGWIWFLGWAIGGFFASMFIVALALAPVIGLIAYLLNKGDAEAF